MLSNANKEQLTEISEYIDSEFGITDDAGRILFYSGAGNQDAAEVELAATFPDLRAADICLKTSRLIRMKCCSCF